MYKKKTLICSVVLCIMSLLSFTISAQIAIDNEAELVSLGTIYGGSSVNPTVVYLTSDITITDASHYLVIGGDNVTFDGKGFTITINIGGIYPGVIKNGSSVGPVNGYSNVTIKNVKLSATTDQLINTGGWIGQESFGYNAINVTIDNCHSNTTQIGTNAGGIVGRYSPARVTNCSSTGAIGIGGGGICGKYFSGTAVNCHSAGYIGGNAGGIIGSFSTGTATNCYSTGTIVGNGSGGIMGSDASTNTAASNCYSRGAITGSNAGGIMAQKSKGNVTNCYSTGTITGTNAGGIVGDLSSGTIAHCYTFASTIMGGTSTSSITDCLVSGGPWSDIRASSVLTGTDGTVWSGYRDGVEEPFTLASITPFVTTWQTDAVNQIIIPLMGDGYDFRVEWGDGTIYDYQGSSSEISEITHQYDQSGIYTVTIRSNTFSGFPRIYLNNFNNRSLLLEIKQWGGGEWSSMNQAFSGASNLTITATDVPDLSSATDLSSMFSNCTSLIGNQYFNNWNVSNITDMNFMFYGAANFNTDLNNWNVYNVSHMSHVFFGASNFNSDLDNWIVANVTDMSMMFSGASNFNSDLGGWDVANVTDMTMMFSGASNFNSDLGGWDVAKVAYMTAMFQGASNFNSDLGSWDVAKVTDMGDMFSGATIFNSSLSSWNVSNVTNMSSMFSGATFFNRSLDGWDVANVTNMHAMFYGASNFNGDLSTWNVFNVTEMSDMFNAATNFNSSLSGWDVSNVTDMRDMFSGAQEFNSNLSNWDMANVTDMSGMFYGALAFNQDISGWNVSNVTDMSDLFNGATSFNQNIRIWNVSKVGNMSSMFNGATAFNQYLAGWNISNINSLDSFLANARLSRANYDALLVGWSTLSTGENRIPNNISASFGLSKYSNLPATTSARNVLASSNNWSITDGGIQNDLTLPTITSSSLSLDNSAITVTFSEAVYPTFRGTGTIETTGFEFAITGGAATLSSTTPTSISTTDNLTFVVGIGLNGTANGSEVVTVKPVVNSIFDLAENEASTTQTNNTVQLNNLNPSLAPTITNFNAITKYYFNRSTTITNPTSNSTGTFSYTSDNANVATIQGNTITFTGVGSAIITALQTADVNYDAASVTAKLIVSSISVLTNTGAISGTNLNYVDQYGKIGGNFGLSANGAILNAKTVLLSIGDSYQGGKIAYILVSGDSGYDANVQHGLIAAINDQSTGIQWYNGNFTTTAAIGTTIGTGFANTNTIIASQGATSTDYAAGLATAYNGSGYTDWYLPSKDELNKLYINRLAIGGFATDGDYWSSSEYTDFEPFKYAWRQGFGDGDLLVINKVALFYVRAVRSF
jgi:surface protein